MSINENTSRWRRFAAAAGALAIGTVGLVGVSTSATAAPGPGQDGAPTAGSVTIHKYAGTTTTHASDGTQLSSPPDRPALAGVEFQIRNVTAIDGVATNLLTPAGWEAVADLNGDVPDLSDLTFGTEDRTVTTGVDGSAQALNLPVGLYYVTETSPGLNPTESSTPPFLVSIPLPQEDGGWLYDVHVYPKSEVESAARKSADASGAMLLGDTVSWTITTPMLSVRPGNSLDTLVVTDELVSQLQFVADSVSAGIVDDGVTTAVSAGDFDDYFTVVAPTTPGGTVTITATAAGLAYLNTLPTSSAVSFTFGTTVVGIGEIVNQATVNVGGLSVATDQASTDWGAALVTKHDVEDVDAVLQGASFELYEAAAGGDRPADGVDPIEVYTTGIDGTFAIDGLKAGQYWLKEIAAPTGYVLPAGETAWRQLTVVAGDTTSLTISNAQHDALNLPLTGANGQLLMIIAGIALVLVAGGGALAVRNRSKHAE